MQERIIWQRQRLGVDGCSLWDQKFKQWVGVEKCPSQDIIISLFMERNQIDLRRSRCFGCHTAQRRSGDPLLDLSQDAAAGSRTGRKKSNHGGHNGVDSETEGSILPSSLKASSSSFVITSGAIKYDDTPCMMSLVLVASSSRPTTNFSLRRRSAGTAHANCLVSHDSR